MPIAEPRLPGKVALVTGGGTHGEIAGTGQAAALLFARHGAKVIVMDLNRDHAEATRSAIASEGGDAAVFVGDVTSKADCRNAVGLAVSQFGGLHILFNNVGISGHGLVTDVSEELWDRVMAVNLKSMMLTSKYAIPAMKTSGSGSIINVASVDGLRAGPWQNTAYSVSKGGVITLTTNMAAHHGRDGVRVNCIAPGMIYGAMIAADVDPELRELRRTSTPLGVEGTAWDVAWAALFLASDESRWITGVTLPVDAGLLTLTPIALMRNL